MLQPCDQHLVAQIRKVMCDIKKQLQVGEKILEQSKKTIQAIDRIVKQ